MEFPKQPLHSQVAVLLLAPCLGKESIPLMTIPVGWWHVQEHGQGTHGHVVW